MLNENSQIICTIQLQESLSMNSALLECGGGQDRKKNGSKSDTLLVSSEALLKTLTMPIVTKLVPHGSWQN